MRISVAVLCGVLLAMLSACTTVTEVNGRPVTGGDAQPKEVSDERRLGLRLQLASRYYEQGNFTIALEEVNQALAIEPNSAAALGLRALVNMELGDTQKARSDFLHALKQEPDNPELNNNYGWFLCRAGQQRASIDYFHKAASARMYLTPALPHRNAGMCLMQIKAYDAAEVELKKSIERDASDPITKLQLARLYIALGKPDLAQFYNELLEKSVGESATTIWIRLKIARARGDTQAQGDYAKELRHRFPQSAEAAALKRGAFDE